MPPPKRGHLFPFHIVTNATKTATKITELIFPLSAPVPVWVIDCCWCFAWKVEQFAVRYSISVCVCVRNDGVPQQADDGHPKYEPHARAHKVVHGFPSGFSTHVQGTKSTSQSQEPFLCRSSLASGASKAMSTVLAKMRPMATRCPRVPLLELLVTGLPVPQDIDGGGRHLQVGSKRKPAPFSETGLILLCVRAIEKRLPQ